MSIINLYLYLFSCCSTSSVLTCTLLLRGFMCYNFRNCSFFMSFSSVPDLIFTSLMFSHRIVSVYSLDHRSDCGNCPFLLMLHRNEEVSFLFPCYISLAYFLFCCLLILCVCTHVYILSLYKNSD
jgi:hypothetical protein